MNSKIRKPSSTTHPFGYLATQDNKQFGYLRISKNGSSSFCSVEEFKLDTWAKISDFVDKPCYCAYRNPLDRFFSSIPETMKRFTNNVETTERIRDIVVSWDVYEELKKLNYEDPKKFLYGFIDIVEWSFFDAHHEPQTTFLLNSEGSPYNSYINIFSLQNMSEAIEAVATEHKIIIETAQRSENCRNKVKSSGHRGIRTNLREIKERLKRNIALSKLERKSKTGDDYINLLINSDVYINREKEATKLYKSILPFKQDSLIKDKLQRIYSLDFKIFDELQKKENLFTKLIELFN